MKYSASYTWDVNKLKETYLPDDYHHVWNILSRNPDNTVKMKSIITDLKMIRGIHSYEIKNISYTVFNILNEQDEYMTHDDNSYYEYLAKCYLKYGLDGIQIKKSITCECCNLDYTYFEQDFKEEELNKKMEEPCYTEKIEYHSIRYESSPGYTTMFCGKCGLFKKTSVNTDDGMQLLGSCITFKKKHSINTSRILSCPYEDWSWGVY